MDNSCQQCLDEICGCDPAEETRESEAKKDSPRSKKAARGGTKVEPIQAADATIVFILGHPESSPETKQIDVYSGLNGYHIRTLPGSRWSHPVMLGAGAGYLAVVDRFQDYDLIRFTNEYAGADPETAFDSDGFPSRTYAWDSIEDLYSIPTPRGTQATSVTIAPSGIALVGLSSPENLPTYLTVDIEGSVAGTPQSYYGKAATLPEPFNT
jgi:hypothetical protein